VSHERECGKNIKFIHKRRPSRPISVQNSRPDKQHENSSAISTPRNSITKIRKTQTLNPELTVLDEKLHGLKMCGLFECFFGKKTNASRAKQNVTREQRKATRRIAKVDGIGNSDNSFRTRDFYSGESWMSSSSTSPSQSLEPCRPVPQPRAYSSAIRSQGVPVSSGHHRSATYPPQRPSRATQPQYATATRTFGHYQRSVPMHLR
jgi:hypothetical protein